MMIQVKSANIVQIKTKDKLLLPGLLFESRKKSKKVAIFLHGNGSSNALSYLSITFKLAESLNAKRMAFLTFSNRGAHYLNRIRKSDDSKILGGMVYELIKDCLKDINGAIEFLASRGYKEFYLIGSSTGANKICVYNYYQPQNPVAKYILIAGADDTGLLYKQLGKARFFNYLKIAKKKIKLGSGQKLIPLNWLGQIFSYQAFYDMANPDGNYNIFSFREYFNKLKLGRKRLFREFQRISKPTLVIYGDKDEYCYGRVPEIVEILKKKSSTSKKFKFVIIKNADHGFTGKERELARVIANWI